MKTIKITITDLNSATRIDKYLASQLPQYSRNAIKRLIENRMVEVNENPVLRVSEKIHNGDALSLVEEDAKPTDMIPENIPIQILFEDEHIIVLNKQPGISVHPTTTQKQGTLVNALLYHVKNLSGIGGELRPGIVHRLDKVTSGVLVAAKHDEVHRKLSEMFKAREVQKVYWAIVHGAPASLEGTIDQPIARHPKNRKIMAVVPDGRPSLTKYKVLETGLGGALLELYPHTGRTHQIRAHLKHLGHPVVGDAVYSRKKNPDRGKLEKFFMDSPGIALHAKSLSFTHPQTRSIMKFDAELPEPFSTVMKEMTR